MIYQNCILARFVNFRVAKVEADLPKMIVKAIERFLAPVRVRLTQCGVLIDSHGVRFDNLNARLEARQKVEGSVIMLSYMEVRLIP